MNVLVVAGPGLVADEEFLRATVDAESQALGVTGRFVAATDVASLRDALAQAGGGAIVVLPGPGGEAREFMQAPGPRADRIVWCDLTRTGPIEVAGGGARLYGRGIWGVTWAIRHAVHRLRHPARRIAYGSGPDQWGELRLPAQPIRRLPVAVIVHGGYWRSVWGADLMDALAIDLAGRGFAAWNLEYRRPDAHGWDATTADVAAGLDAVAAAVPLDPDRVAVIGHSAGGQLAFRAAADSPDQVALAVSLAGVLDLAEGAHRGMGIGAIPAALGGTPATVPEVYAAADPMARLPLGVPQLVVQGRADDPDLVDCGRRYVPAARAAGDEVVQLELPGDHFAVIDPAAEIWRTTVARIQTRLRVHT